MDAIFTRRSIRKYKTEPVSDENIEYLLKAAMAAPSAKNQQPWEFIVITDRELLNEIQKVHPYASMLSTAPMAIMVCADMVRDGYQGFFPLDCSAAVQNILLAATSRGLGSVWLGCYPNEERQENLKAIFNLPEHIIPFALIAIGSPDEEKGPSERFEKERIHYDKW